MAHFLRVGDTLINLDLCSDIDLGWDSDPETTPESELKVFFTMTGPVFSDEDGTPVPHMVMFKDTEAQDVRAYFSASGFDDTRGARLKVT